MPLTTTTIGAYPKPAYVPISDWFTKADGDYTSAYLDEIEAAGAEAEALFERAVHEVVADQVNRDDAVAALALLPLVLQPGARTAGKPLTS